MKTVSAATVNASFYSIKTELWVFGRLIGLLILIMIFSCSANDDGSSVVVTPPGEETPNTNIPPDGSLNPENFEYSIVYIDLEPDYVNRQFRDIYNLDLNDDDVEDFVMYSNTTDWEDSFEIKSKVPTNKFLGVAPWYVYAVPIKRGVMIYDLARYQDGENFENVGYFYIGSGTESSSEYQYDWKNKADRFIGIKFDIDGALHYGWLRLDIEDYSHWIIREYAYNAIPNSPIFPGQTE